MKIYLPQKDIYFDIVLNYAVIDALPEEEIAADEKVEVDDTEIEEISDSDIKLSISKYDVDIKFYEFIQNVIGVLDVRNFDIVKQEGSDIKNHNSYYISFYPVDKDGTELTDYMIHFRISDHFIKGINRRSADYFQQLSNDNKKDENSDIQAYIFRNIVINEKSEFKTTGQALDYLHYLCDRLRIGDNDMDVIDQDYRKQKKN